jgi:nicotinamidase-related amidase
MTNQIVVPLNRVDIVSATVEEILALFGVEPSPTGSGFVIVRNVLGAHIAVDVQEGFSPRGMWLASPYTDDNVWAVNQVNTFRALARIRVATRDYHPDSGVGMAHVSYQLAFRALVNSPEFVVFLTTDMLDQMGKTDAEVFTDDALRTGLTIVRVRSGIEAMPGQTLPVWTGEHVGMSLRDSRFNERLDLRGFTDVLCKGTFWQAPWWENFSGLMAAGSKIVVPADGSLPYIEGPSTGCHELLTRKAQALGFPRVDVVTATGDDSEYCDLATVLDLLKLKYEVVVAYEGMAPLSPVDEAVAFRQMQDAGGIFASNAVLEQANQILADLLGI